MNEMLCSKCRQKISNTNNNILTIEKKVCEKLEVSNDLIFQKDRHSNIVLCRAIIFYFARKTGWALKPLAQRYDMHHTTIISALRMIDDLIFTDEKTRNVVKNINDLLLESKIKWLK